MMRGECRKMKPEEAMIDDVGLELLEIVQNAGPKLNAMSEQDCAVRLSMGKWSRKEILGHLIDSASNNHQRFVRCQLNSEIKLGGYKQSLWVATQ
jgi:hypothetical protein